MQPAHMPTPNAMLMLEGGVVFSGFGIGAQGISAGEICFTTGMTGYQETLTDPSFAGQIITFTFPHIGNVGANAEDIESGASVLNSATARREASEGESRSEREQRDALPSSNASNTNKTFGASRAAGLVVREAITEASNFRAHQHLNTWLTSQGLTGISGVDTRALTRYIRAQGACNAVIGFGELTDAFIAQMRAALASAPNMKGLELAAAASRSAAEPWQQQRWALGAGYGTLAENAAGPHVVAIDFGMKHNIARNLASLGCRITIVPATTRAEAILALKPDGVFLSNGPGDPAATGAYALPTIRALLDAKIPLFGICLGHQLLGLALGAQTEKMKQGHRGTNHPVKDLRTGKVEITSQNHGFAIADAGLPAEVEVTHRSLFDGTIQGIAHRSQKAFSVQGHPEASPGPHDSRYLFTQFMESMAS